jgi:hypothetical protein
MIGAELARFYSAQQMQKTISQDADESNLELK